MKLSTTFITGYVKNKLVHIFMIFGVAILFLPVVLSGQTTAFAKGADGSILDQIESDGGKYYENGIEKDAYQIFKDHGFNHIRLKLWHTPQNEYNSLPNVLEMAKRIKDLNVGFLLDFHYSDTWADPGNQEKPSAWVELPFNTLGDSVYEYTKKVVLLLKAQNTLPDMVQIGNEISCGMLWDDGRICGEFATPEQWEKFGILVKKGIQGVNESLDDGEDIKIIIHFDNGANNVGCQWFYTNLLNQDVEFDIIGLSYYPWWHGTLTELQNNLNDLATRFEKDIIVVESAYPWTLDWGDMTNNLVGSEDQLHEGYPATVEGQKQFLTDVMAIIKNTTDGRGTGFMYWSPEWIPGRPGSPWENLALFDFEGEVLESILAFSDNSSVDDGLDQMPQLINHPNPFRELTEISFFLKESGSVKLVIYDQTGKVIDTLQNEFMHTGLHKVVWNSIAVPPGIYFIRLTSNDNPKTIRAIKTN